MLCRRLLAQFSLATAVLLAATMMTASSVPAAELLVLEKSSKTLAIIDPGTMKVLARVPSGPDPHEVVASEDGTHAYISNYGGEGGSLNFISVVDLHARKPLPPIDLGALHSAHGLDFKGGKLYFTAETSKVIGRYDPATQKIDWVLGTGQDRTHMLIVAKDLEHIYTSNVSSGTISIIRSGTAPSPPGLPPHPVWSVTNVVSGRGSEGFDIAPDGRQIWAANAQDGTITAIDVPGARALETFTVPVSNANRLKFSLDGRYVLVTGLGTTVPGSDSGGINLVVLERASHKLVKSLALGGGSAGILMDPSGSRAFIAVSQANKVAVLDLHTLDLGTGVGANQPDGMAWAGTPSISGGY